MNLITKNLDRRNFIRTGSAVATGFTAFSLMPQLSFGENRSSDEDINIIGPKEGYSPQIGTLVSMLTWMRRTVLRSVEKLNQQELDFLFDQNSNTIGSLLLHLAATESFYLIHTAQDIPWGKFSEPDAKRWDIPMNLGEEARKTIKGHDLKYYTDILAEVRENSLAEFRKRDDKWLMKVDPKFFGGMPTNNYCKWFHVCEHESNHNGQIKWLAKRLPGAKPGNE